jgi:hypothetical protein
MKALFVATFLVVGVSGLAQANPSCHFNLKDRAWQNCRPVIGNPGVPDERYMRMKAPQKGASPGDGCEVVKNGRGAQLWRCPPGTIQSLRAAMGK